MQIEMTSIDSIKPYRGNPRINDAAIQPVALSITSFGFNQPIVVDRNSVIVVGHTRYHAALEMGLEKVPVYRAEHLSDAQAKAYRLADNQTASLSRFDEAKLVTEILDLQQMDFPMLQTGFTSEEITQLIANQKTDHTNDLDAIPEPPDAATTQPGDLYQLGKHRLLCGDAAQWKDVERLTNRTSVSMVHTDPPYNVKVEPRSNNAIAAGNSSFQATTRKRSHHQSLDLSLDPGKSQPTHQKLRAKDRPLINDFVSDEVFAQLLDAWFGNLAKALQPGGALYVWGGYANIANYPPALKKHGLYFSQSLIWHKLHPVLTRKDFMGDHEWCFYGWREGKAHRYFGPHNATDVWQVKKVNPQSMIHLTEKPVELAVRALEYSSKPGETVLDLFGGSGSTLIAAEQTNRTAYLMELDPLYCDVIVQRWETFTDKKAIRESAA